MKRPNLTHLRRPRARAAEHDAPGPWTSSSARGPGPPTQQRVFFRDLKTQAADRLRHDGEFFADGTNTRASSPGGSSTAPRCSTGRTSSCSGNTAVQAAVRAGRHRSDRQDGARRRRAVQSRRRVRQAARAPAASTPARTTSSSSRTRRYQRSLRAAASASAAASNAARSSRCQIAVLPREGVDREGGDRRRRAHHADPPRAEARRADDFDIATQDRVSQAVGPDQPGARSSRWSSSRRSR